MRASILLVFLAGFSACSQPTVEPAPDPANQGPVRDPVAEARAMMKRGEIDEAMIAVDEVLQSKPDDRDARMLRAQGSIGLFESGRQPAQVFLQDAVRDLEYIRDGNGDDTEALLALSHCQLRLGEFEESRDTALHAAEVMANGDATFDAVASAMIQASDAEMQLFVDVRRQELADGMERPGDDSREAANKVLIILKSVEQRGPRPAARVRTAQVYQWMNRGLDALQELEEGLRALPDSNDMHQAFQQAYWQAGKRRECVVAYKRLLRESPGSGALRWYLGRAQVALADDLRRKTDWAESAKFYQDALATFRSYDSVRRSERAATGQWLAICELSLGRLAYERGELEESREHYEAAYDASAAVADYDENGVPKVYDSFGGNYLGGLSLIGEAIAERSDDSALLDSLAFYESILERHPDRFGSIYNNAALSARDLGVQIDSDAADDQRESATREALELWERSYRYYEKAVGLSPNDARIVNDCGLMLVYHLHRDYDRARVLFDDAIVLGEAQLAELPEDVDPDVRRSLEEAVGDAYQNIGVMLAVNLSRPFAEAVPFLEKAVEFYPYQRREAARMLRRMRGQSDAQGAVKAKFENAVRPARQHAEARDWDSALLVMDEVAKDEEIARYAPFQHLYGVYSLDFAEAASAAGQGVGLVDGLFQDAVRHLTQSVELDSDPIPPRLDLARALLAANEAKRSAEVATSLLSHIRSVGGADPEVLNRVHAVRAEAAARAFVQAKQAGEDDQDLLRDARSSFREIEETDAFDDARRTLWINVERWAGADEQAIQIAIRAWRRAPDERIAELVELGAQLGDSGAVVEALAQVDSATELWWNGRAHFDRAQQLWAVGESATAADTLDAAVALFERSMATNDDYRDSCEQWSALCLGAQALVLASADRVDEAESALLDALRRRPDVFENDLGNGASIKRAVLVIGDRYYQAQQLGKTAEFYRRVGALVPRDVDVANNEGLSCRDYGSILERDGKGDEARGYQEASYAAYTRASELDPTNVRLMNDRALLLIYHLGRELDTAVALLDEAIRVGQRQIDQDPPDEPRALRDLQEAVGDAYGNLGVYHMRYTSDLTAARANFEKSLEYYPFAERIGTRALQRIAESEKEQADEEGTDGEDR